MIKSIKISIYLFIFLFSLLIFAKDIYVATDGDDTTGNGTITNPYKTFSKAIAEMSPGDVCIIRGGIYKEELSVSKNGTVDNYLTFKAADGETVEIKATSVINGWQPHNGNIYKTTVNMSIDSRFRAIYHNGDYMDLARWPNNTDNNRWTVDCTPVTGGDGSHFLADNIPNIDWTGGMVYYLGAHSGASWTRTITSSSSGRIDHMGVDITKWPFTPHNPTVWRKYPNNNRGQLYLFNKLEALDHSREWYYDVTSNTLYLQTPDGTIPANDSVEYAARQFTAQLRGDYIKLEGLNFFGGSIKVHNNADNNQIINCKITHGVEGHDALTNSSAQVPNASIEILGANTVVRGSNINHSAVSGITIASWSGAHNCIIEKNYISNTDYVGIHASPIRSSANNIKILKNTIFNTGRDGMYVAGSNCEVAYNDVSSSQIINSDSGVFYTVGNNNLKNNEIHHNWFHDATAPSYSHETGKLAKAAGIYLDNNSKGYSVHHNVVWNVSWSGYQVNWNNTNLDFYHNTIWNAERAMDSWVNGFTQSDNKIYNNYANTGDWFAGNGSSEFDIKDSPIFADSPFENANSQNFMPASGSTLVDRAPIISGFNKPFKGSSPDIGAYERGGTRWTAGVNAIEDTGEALNVSILNTQFTISTTSETCPDKNNGTILIVADIEENYSVSFNGQEASFTQDITLENIEPGHYDLCLSINGKSEKQCFKAEITEANEITAKSSLSNQKQLFINIDQGTAPYSISINDEIVQETYAKSFSIDVNDGDIVKIETSKDCEGKIIESIDLFGSVSVSPNPTSGHVQLSLPVSEGEVIIEVYDIYSRVISSKQYTIISGKIDASLKDQPSGIYFARIMNAKAPTNIKIIKK